jgi:hypothetical protein
MKYSLRLLAGLAVTFSLGCGKSDAEKFADSYCAEIAKCCGQAGLPADGKVCHQWAAFAEAGGSYNASAGNACLAEIKTEVSAGTFCADQSSSGPSQCDSVYGTSSNGSKKPGETCDFDSDCASSSLGAVACASLYVNGAFIDKCQVRIPGKAGDACIGTQDGLAFASYQTSDATDVPAQGYVCSTSDSLQCQSGTCVALLSAGATCSSTSDCVRTTYCDYSKGQCTARVATGSTCKGSDSSECVDGDYCDSTSKLCAAKKANGATCTTLDECQSSNCPSGTCQSNGLDTFGLTLLCGS